MSLLVTLCIYINIQKIKINLESSKDFSALLLQLHAELDVICVCCTFELKLHFFLLCSLKLAALWAAPPRCGYWGSLGFFCSAPQDFGMLGVFYARFPPREASFFFFFYRTSVLRVGFSFEIGGGHKPLYLSCYVLYCSLSLFLIFIFISDFGRGRGLVKSSQVPTLHTNTK